MTEFSLSRALACSTHFSKFLFVVLLSSVMVQASATDGASRFEPATLINDGQDYLSRMKFPGVEGNTTMVVRCYAHAHIDGFAEDAECFGSMADGSDEDFVRSVLRATRKFKVNPAKVDGRPVPVWFNFSFQFTQSNGKQAVKIYPNHLRYGVFYGGKYSSPQRIDAHQTEHSISTAVRVNTEFLDDSLLDKSVTPRMIKQNCGVVKYLRTDTRVSSNGVALNVRVASKDEDGMCQELAQTRPLRGEYIPAFHKGKPFAAIFSETYGRSAYSGPLGKCHDRQLSRGYRVNQDSAGTCD